MFTAVAVLGWGQGGTGPPKSCPGPPNFWLVPGPRVYWVYRRTRVYAVYQPLVFFWQRIITSFVIIKQVIRGLYALTGNKRMCTAPCHTKLLNFFPCTFCLTCNAYSWEALLAYNLISIKTSYNTITDKNQKQYVYKYVLSFLFFDVRCQPVAYFRDQGLPNWSLLAEWSPVRRILAVINN